MYTQTKRSGLFIHVDIDSFFASAERSVNDSLKHIPICVGSRSNLEIFNKKGGSERFRAVKFYTSGSSPN